MSSARRLLIVVSLLGLLATLTPVGQFGMALLVLLGAPGYLIERHLSGPSRPLLVRLTLWMGLSVSLVALLYQWLWAASISLAPAVLSLATLILALVSFGLAWRDLAQTRVAWPGLTLLLTLIIFALTLWTRFVQIADLALPAWVDSVHHALMVRIVLETGMAPSSLEPYLPVVEMPYHWGYHVFVASVAQVAGQSPADVLLLSGQIFNALHALTVAGLALVLWRRPVAAPVAALVVGLLSLMPAYYVSWGRYTQLVGLLMLPAAAIAWQAWLAQPRRGWWFVTALVLAGLSLVHVRVLIFALALLAAQSLVWALGQAWPQVRQRLWAGLALGLAVAGLTAPWLLLLLNRTLLPGLGSGGLVGSESYNAFNAGLLWVGQMHWLVAFALLGAMIGLWYRQRNTATLLLWVGVMLLAANPWLLSPLVAATGVLFVVVGLIQCKPALVLLAVAFLVPSVAGVQLPTLWLLNNDAVVISLFLPVALLIAGGAARFSQAVGGQVRPRWHPALLGAGTSLILGLGFWGASELRSVVNPTTVLADQADLAALTWADAQLPPDARILINAAPWLAPARRGVDGGWWLMPLTGRWTSTPPVLSTYGSPAFMHHVNAVGDTVIGYQPGGEQAIFDLIGRERLTHIYLVEGRGPLQPTIFAGRPGFTQLYAANGVVIFAVDPP
ncbi:MAG: hypothetical protein AB4911_17575 [Oscillochloridaceae bacterium umkhey_bin13]